MKAASISIVPMDNKNFYSRLKQALRNLSIHKFYLCESPFSLFLLFLSLRFLSFCVVPISDSSSLSSRTHTRYHATTLELSQWFPLSFSLSPQRFRERERFSVGKNPERRRRKRRILGVVRASERGNNILGKIDRQSSVAR